MEVIEASMRHHLQEGLTVETTTMIIIVAHEMAMVEVEKYTLAAEVTYIQVAMNVVGEKCFHLLIGNTLSMWADKKEDIHLWIGCIVHLVKQNSSSRFGGSHGGHGESRYESGGRY